MASVSTIEIAFAILCDVKVGCGEGEGFDYSIKSLE
jgi:hypothetical protein